MKLNMRITVKESGEIWTRETTTPYTGTYTQPLFDFIKAWAYHNLYEMRTFRIWLWIEKKWPKKFGEEWTLDDGEILYIPPTSVQDIRCFELAHKNRIEVTRVFGEEVRRRE